MESDVSIRKGRAQALWAGPVLPVADIIQCGLVGGAGTKAAAALVAGRGGAPGSRRIKDESALSDVFGIDLASEPVAKLSKRRKDPPPAVPPSPSHRRVDKVTRPKAQRLRDSPTKQQPPTRKQWAARRRAVKKG